MPNPFVYGTRIIEQDRFVGRKDQLKRIFGTLDTIHTGQLQSISIVGPRRIGRSSLLYHLKQVFPKYLSYPERYIFTYIDLESGQYGTLNSLLRGILEELSISISLAETNDSRLLHRELKKVIRNQELDLAAFEAGIQQFSKIPTLPLYPVICLDEFEQLIEYSQEFPDRLYDSWRSLMNANHVAFVIVSTKPLPNLSQTKKLTSPFFNIFSTFIELSELTQAESQELINWGRSCDRPFMDNDCRRALRIARHHPLKLQLIGHLIYEAKVEPVNFRTELPS